MTMKKNKLQSCDSKNSIYYLNSKRGNQIDKHSIGFMYKLEGEGEKKRVREMEKEKERERDDDAGEREREEVRGRDLETERESND